MSEKDLQKEILDLKTELRRLKKNYLGLGFEDKLEDVVTNCQENIPVLKEIKAKRILSRDQNQNNLLIEGDNYHSLSVLNYTHKEKIDLIYIDPPYNTGNKDFVYNDNYVDKEDGYRHSKWLSFMRRRLELAKNLLKESGVIFISIDDNEQAHLRILCDKIFGENNFVANLIWKSKSGGANDSRFFAVDHEYILVYAKNVDKYALNLDTEAIVSTSYNLEDERGEYALDRLDKQSLGYLPSLDFPIKDPDGKIYKVWHKNSEQKVARWRWSEQTVSERYSELVFQKGFVYTKNYKKDGAIPRSLLIDERFGRTRTGKTLLGDIFGKEVFSNPKPTKLVKYIISLSTNKDAKVLDFMAGSGTTGQAILELNQEDKGKREFILCTSNELNGVGSELATQNSHQPSQSFGICQRVTYQRLKRVIEGYKNKKNEKVAGLGGNLFYYKTDLVNIEKIHKIPDEAKIRVTYQAGEMIAVREDTLNEVEKNEWWQIFEGKGRMTTIYFKEDKSKLGELIEKLEKKSTPVALYIFSWGKNEYKGEYSSINIRVEDIPEPILEVYKEINRL